MRPIWRLQEYHGHVADVFCCRLGSKSSQILASGGADKRVCVWQVGQPKALVTLTGHASSPACLVFDQLEESLVVGCAGGSIQVWNLDQQKVQASFTGHRTSCECVEFHPYGDFFASGSNDTNMKIWDLRRKACIQTYKGHSAGITCVRFSPHGRWVATAGVDATVKLWDLTAGKLMREFSLHKSTITSMDFHPDEFFLATGSTDRTVKVWNLETFKNCGGTEIGTGAVQHVKFHPESKSLISAFPDQLRSYSLGNLNAPPTCFESEWGTNLLDLQIPQNKLLGISAEGAAVSVWVGSLKKKDEKPDAANKASAAAAQRVAQKKKEQVQKEASRSEAGVGALANHHSVPKIPPKKAATDTGLAGLTHLRRTTTSGGTTGGALGGATSSSSSSTSGPAASLPPTSTSSNPQTKRRTVSEDLADLMPPTMPAKRRDHDAVPRPGSGEAAAYYKSLGIDVKGTKDLPGGLDVLGSSVEGGVQAPGSSSLLNDAISGRWSTNSGEHASSSSLSLGRGSRSLGSINTRISASTGGSSGTSSTGITTSSAPPPNGITTSAPPSRRPGERGSQSLSGLVQPLAESNITDPEKTDFREEDFFGRASPSPPAKSSEPRNARTSGRESPGTGVVGGRSPGTGVVGGSLQSGGSSSSTASLGGGPDIFKTNAWNTSAGGFRTSSGSKKSMAFADYLQDILPKAKIPNRILEQAGEEIVSHNVTTGLKVQKVVAAHQQPPQHTSDHSCSTSARDEHSSTALMSPTECSSDVPHESQHHTSPQPARGSVRKTRMLFEPKGGGGDATGVVGAPVAGGPPSATGPHHAQAQVAAFGQPQLVPNARVISSKGSSSSPSDGPDFQFVGPAEPPPGIGVGVGASSAAAGSSNVETRAPSSYDVILSPQKQMSETEKKLPVRRIRGTVAGITHQHRSSNHIFGEQGGNVGDQKIIDDHGGGDETSTAAPSSKETTGSASKESVGGAASSSNGAGTARGRGRSDESKSPEKDPVLPFGPLGGKPKQGSAAYHTALRSGEQPIRPSTDYNQAGPAATTLSPEQEGPSSVRPLQRVKPTAANAAPPAVSSSLRRHASLENPSLSSANTSPEKEARIQGKNQNPAPPAEQPAQQSQTSASSDQDYFCELFAKQHDDIASLYKKRLEQSRTVVHLWNAGKVSDVLEIIAPTSSASGKSSVDASLLGDFCRTVVGSRLFSRSLTLEAVVRLLPGVRVSLLGGKYGEFRSIGQNFVDAVLAHFGAVLLETQRNSLGGHKLDVAGEERLRRAEDCISELRQIQKMNLPGNNLQLPPDLRDSLDLFLQKVR